MADESTPIDSDQALDGELLDQKQKPGTAVVELSSIYHSGPLPPPDVLKGYDQIVPGAAERISSWHLGAGLLERQFKRLSCLAHGF